MLRVAEENCGGGCNIVDEYGRRIAHTAEVAHVDPKRAITREQAKENARQIVLRYEAYEPLRSGVEQMRLALEAALPLLIRLGDFIGNEQGRCEAILKVRGGILIGGGKA